MRGAALVTMIAAGLLIALPVHAQDAATPAPKPAPSAEKLALAHQIIVASGGETQLRAKLMGFLSATNQLSADMIPSTARVTTTEIMSEIQSAFLEALPQIIVLGERAYADNLTEQEMRDYAAWLQSDSGRSIRDKSVAISTEIILGEGPLLRQMMPGLVQKAIDRACARSQCTTQDRTIIAGAVAKAMQQKS